MQAASYAILNKQIKNPMTTMPIPKIPILGILLEAMPIPKINPSP